MCRHIDTDKSLRSLAANLGSRVNGNVTSIQNRQDLLQELALIVCEKNDQELAKIDGYFNFWCVRTMINMCGKRGNFTKLYGQRYYNTEDLRFDSELEYDATVDNVLDRIEDLLNEIKGASKNGWYKRDLFKAYFELGTYRAVEKEIGIDHSSVYLTVKEVKQTIKSKL